MTDSIGVNDFTNINDPNGPESPGQYVAAFFMVIKAGDPASRHRDDKYIRETRFSPVGRHLSFINWQAPYYGPDLQTYITVLYQHPGSGDFNIQLMSMPMPEREYRPMTGAFVEQIWREEDRLTRKKTDRHLWNIAPNRGSWGIGYMVKMNGNRIEIRMRTGRDGAMAASNGAGEHQAALWKFNGDERPLNITMTKLGPFDYTLNIPSIEEMRSGSEFSNANFMSVALNNLDLKGCKLPDANFTNAPVANVRFDNSKLRGSNFSLQEDWFTPDMIMNDVIFTLADLSNARFDKRPIDDCKFDRAILNNTSFKQTHFRNADFKGADLTKTDFTEVDFNGILLNGTEKLGRTANTGTIFRRASIPYSLIGKDWQYLDLSETRFTGTISAGTLAAANVKLIGTQLPGISLVNANFTNADLTRANFAGADLTGANFTGANLTGAVFTGAKLRNAIFTRTTLAATILNGADLTGANFTASPVFGRTTDNRTRLQGATLPVSFIGANWSYLDLTRAILLDKGNIPQNLNAAYVILDEVNLNGANLSNANLEHAQLKQTQLPNATLTDAKLNYGILIGTVFTNSTLRQVEMDHADITNADFSGAELWGSNAKLTQATAVNVSFNHAFLVNMDFSNIKDKSLQGCSFTDACLVNAKFMNTILGTFNGKKTNFANSCLQGADFDNADLSEANLNNASISTDSGSFQATIRSQSFLPPITFDATVIAEEVTSAGTVCPSGGQGPCTAEKWITSPPRPNSWNYRGFQQPINE